MSSQSADEESELAKLLKKLTRILSNSNESASDAIDDAAAEDENSGHAIDEATGDRE